MMRISLLILCTLLSSSIWADIQLAPLLNKISLQLQAEQWVTTKTALVTVGINAAVADKGIDKIQAEVMQKLNQLSNKSTWHVLSFHRQLDGSGLENIQISAEARLLQAELANLRNKAKAMSKPGETFTIDNIQFTPSDEELKQANIDLRRNLYQQVKVELDAINKMYPEQKYYVHQINFNSGTPPMEPVPLANNNLMMAKAAVERTPPLSVGNKMQLQATVMMASLPDLNGIGQKLLH